MQRENGTFLALLKGMKSVVYILVAILIVPQSAFAIVPAEQKTIAPEDVPAVATTESSITQQDVAQVIPLNMAPTTDMALVAKQVMDKSVKSIVNSDLVKNNPVAQAAANLENTLNTDVAVGGNEPGEIAHKFNVALMAFQTAAKFNYSGFFKASATYKALEKNVLLTVSEDLSQTTRIQFNHDNSAHYNGVSLTLDW